MNLYRIIVIHGAPKDSHTSTETYFVANNEGQVFDWLDKKAYGRWTDATLAILTAWEGLV